MRQEFNFNFKMLLFNAKLYHSPACKSPRNKKRVEAVLEQLKPKYSNLGIFDPNNEFLFLHHKFTIPEIRVR